ncbi:cytochrome P450 [Mycena albidolilacea]|uniref:Cytochrome P450 n=1 Tax=Mycena albidolilacea TaxID=1033008 RepID=A0AAD6Z3N2_9AGAR|nr:cytochrome P450 [Mycena albidolilacea]
MDSTSLTLGAGILLLLSFAIHHAGKPTPLPLIPHNSNLKWFVGDIPFIAKLAKERGGVSYAFDDTALRLGPVSQIVIGLGASWIGRTFGLGQVIVILADYQEMHDLLVNRAAEFDRSKLVNNLFAATLPQGMLALPTNQQFKHHKRYLGITMTNPYLARMTPRIVDRMQELVDLWSVAAKRLAVGSSTEVAFNALDDIRLSSIDVIASITFGTSFDGVKASLEYLDRNPSASPSSRPATPKLVTDLEVLLETIGSGIFFPVPTLLPWWTRTFNHKWRKALTNTHSYLRSRLSSARVDYEAERNTSEKSAAHRADNVLDIILERERGDQTRGAKTLTEAEIIDELTTFALGGSETTAATMQWSVKILCKHPAVQYKLRTELLNNLPVINTRPPTYTEISDETNLPYLSAVMYEILRCSRTAAAIDRDVTCDTTLLGYPIPKGTRLQMPIGMVQQLESEGSKHVTDTLDSVRSASSLQGRKTGYWSATDAHLFNPERWLRPDGSFNATAGPWLPFSYGFRGCFGQKLALIQLRLFLAIAQFNFFFDALPEELNGWKSHETVTSHPVQCYVRPIPWDNVGMSRSR